MNATLDSTTVIRSYPDLARNLYSMISAAKNEIHLAPRYYEPSIGSVLLSKFAEGLTLRILDSNPSGISFEDRLRTVAQHDTKNRDLILKILATPKIITRVNRLDFSFAVVDGRQCGFELVNPTNPDNFTLALKVDSPDLAKELILVFESMVASAERSKRVTTPKSAT
jgi:hypothetical protein